MPPTPAIASSGNASNGLGNGVHANGNANTLPGNTNGIHTNGMGIGSTSNGYFNGVHTNGNGDGINVNDDSESSDTLSMGRNSSTQSQQSAADSSSDGSLVAPATAQSAAASSSDRFLILPAPQPSSIPFIPTLSTHPTIATDAPFVPITGPASSQNYIAPPITLPAPQTSVSPPFQVSAAIYPLASAAAPRVLPSASGPTIIASAPPTTRKIKTNRTPSLIDREERAIANMLTRFRNLVQLAAMQKDEGDSATQEVAATQAFALEVESAALVPTSLPVHSVCRRRVLT